MCSRQPATVSYLQPFEFSPQPISVRSSVTYIYFCIFQMVSFLVVYGLSFVRILLTACMFPVPPSSSFIMFVKITKRDAFHQAVSSILQTLNLCSYVSDHFTEGQVKSQFCVLQSLRFYINGIPKDFKLNGSKQSTNSICPYVLREYNCDWPLSVPNVFTLPLFKVRISSLLYHHSALHPSEGP